MLTGINRSFIVFFDVCITGQLLRMLLSLFVERVLMLLFRHFNSADADIQREAWTLLLKGNVAKL